MDDVRSTKTQTRSKDDSDMKDVKNGVGEDYKLTPQVATRFYRAPELICKNKE